METKFNFKSQICTSRVQSERLLSLGLKKETADMVLCKPFDWEKHKHSDGCVKIVLEEEEDICKDDIPAWSLGRLWELYWSNKVVSDCLFGCGKYMNPYAKMIAMIEYDIEDGTFNNDYLDK